MTEFTYDEAMRLMRDRDPDGWTYNVPTQQDYDNFNQWAINQFGRERFNEYLTNEF